MPDLVDPEILSWKHSAQLVPSLCAEASRSGDPTTRANFALDWEAHPEALLNQLNRGLYSGEGADYLVMIARGGVVCGAGCYVLPDVKFEGRDLTVIMSRMYTVPEWRVHWAGTEILKRLAKIVRTTHVITTFNHRNYPLYVSLKTRGKGLDWPPIWGAFKPLGLRTINHCPQWVARASTEDLLSHIHD